MTAEEPSNQKTWGIIRYAPGSGTFPEDDAAAFDGWYGDRQDALAVAQDWVAQHPQWIVGLVQSELCLVWQRFHIHWTWEINALPFAKLTCEMGAHKWLSLDMRG